MPAAQVLPTRRQVGWYDRYLAPMPGTKTVPADDSQALIDLHRYVLCPHVVKRPGTQRLAHALAHELQREQRGCAAVPESYGENFLLRVVDEKREHIAAARWTQVCGRYARRQLRDTSRSSPGLHRSGALEVALCAAVLANDGAVLATADQTFWIQGFNLYEV